MSAAVTEVLRSLGADELTVADLVGLPDLRKVTVAAAPAWMRAMWIGPVAAMTLGRRVFVDPTVMAGDRITLARLIVHELVHVRQWRTIGAWRFLVRYVRGYLTGRIQGRSHRDSYADIPFEVEARLMSARLTFR